jgi:hypothetical protein
MKISTVLLIAIIIFACILAAGCTQPRPPAPVTDTTQTAAPPQTPACSLTPGPSQDLPAYESVSITVDRNTISDSPTVTTTFNGGQGLGMVKTMTVTLIRSDCRQDVQVRKNPGIGTSVTQMGTTKTDRVIVVLAMLSGDQYTVIDKGYPFPAKM